MLHGSPGIEKEVGALQQNICQFCRMISEGDDGVRYSIFSNCSTLNINMSLEFLTANGSKFSRNSERCWSVQHFRFFNQPIDDLDCEHLSKCTSSAFSSTPFWYNSSIQKHCSTSKKSHHFREIILSFKCGCFQKIGGKPPKWMVKIMENPIFVQWMIWVFSHIFGSPPFL